MYVTTNYSHDVYLYIPKIREKLNNYDAYIYIILYIHVCTPIYDMNMCIFIFIYQHRKNIHCVYMEKQAIEQNIKYVSIWFKNMYVDTYMYIFI